MWFPKNRRSMFQRVVAAVCQSWERVRRERRLAQVRSRRERRPWDCRGALVQVLEPRTMLTIDLGDAPSPYPTTLAENGARHDDSGPTLGATRDSEVDGTHSANADADGADEDGVTFGTIQAGALGATATVNVANAPSGAKLDAWIDFNGDGNWGGPDEEIASSMPVVNGNNTIAFDVPSGAKAGTTFARFRLSTAGNLGPEGLAADGEVEDYAVTTIPPVLASGVFIDQHIVTTGFDGAYNVIAADVDGDGDMDMLSAASVNNNLLWYENDGSQNFTAHTISTVGVEVLSMTTADLDGDGDLDVLGVSRNDSKLAWWENDGSQNFTLHTISTATVGTHSVVAADVDGDGDIDLVIADANANKIAWYENDGNQNFTARTVSATVGIEDVACADVDGDGDLDVLVADPAGDTLFWYENDGNQNFTAHTIGQQGMNGGVRCVTSADMDGDGDVDVLSAGGERKISWYENDGSQNFTRHSIYVVDAKSVVAADIDGDGDMDALSVESSNSEMVWYENDGAQNFLPHPLGTAASGSPTKTTTIATTADMDGDGDLDILSASSANDRISWYENLPLNQNSPMIGAFDTTVTYGLNAPVVIDANATVTDADTTRFNGGILIVRLAPQDLQKALTFRSVTRLIGVSGSNLTYRGTTVATFTGHNSSFLVITFNANATLSAVQTVLRNVTFWSLNGQPSTVVVTLTDGTGTASNHPTKTLTFAAAPIPPSGSAPSIPPVASNQSGSTTAGPLSDTNSSAGHTFSSTQIAAVTSSDNDQYGDDLLSPVDVDDLGRRRKRRRNL
ncbi:MAG: VCBS repeat-containing protein [Planctomycetota bacterium]